MNLNMWLPYISFAKSIMVITMQKVGSPSLVVAGCGFSANLCCKSPLSLSWLPVCTELMLVGVSGLQDWEKCHRDHQYCHLRWFSSYHLGCSMSVKLRLCTVMFYASNVFRINKSLPTLNIWCGFKLSACHAVFVPSQNYLPICKTSIKEET